MSHTAAFQLESLPYQTAAVEAVVGVFEGTPKPAAADLAGNRCTLSWGQISANLEAVALRHRISDERPNLTAPAQGQALIEYNLGVSVAQSFALKRLDMDFFGEE